MSDFDFENRKNNRRQNIQKKNSDRKSNDKDYSEIHRAKKQLKRDIEDLRQEELWEDWDNEIR